jgi:adenylate cyclase
VGGDDPYRPRRDDRELHHLAFGIPVGVLGEGEEHRGCGPTLVSSEMFSIRSAVGFQPARPGTAHIDARAGAGFEVDLVEAPYAGQEMSSVRRLTAILAADVAGYSRLMGADEEGTHERLKAHLGELVNPKIKEHRGRIVKNTGDGFLAEFSSVVDAVRCAAEVQRAMADRNSGTPEDKRITFRIGVNLGDVIAEEDDIYGDGVNVAARLEALAEPGGICVSRVVRDQIRDKLPYPFEDRGEQSVKNIVRSVRVYALRPETIAELPVAGAPIAVHRRPRSIVAPIAAAVAAVLVIAVMTWWVWPATKPSTSPIVAAATSVATPFVAPRLSIVVLPFANISDDRQQQYFADGVTEDLTTDLSRIAHMFVISRNTAFTYRDKPVDAKQIGRELGVRYILEGSVRRSGNQVRVNTQLIDAATDAHLWAERFDRDVGDLFALQNDITRQIAVALSAELVSAEAARLTEHPDAFDYVLRARAASNKGATPANFSQAVDLYEQALALDPRSVEVQSMLALTLSGRVLAGMTSSSADDIARAKKLITQALTASPSSTLAHFANGQLLRAERRCEEAVPELEVVIASYRNSPNALHSLAYCKILTGAIEEAIPLEEQAIRLGPRDPFVYSRYLAIGQVHLLQSRIEEAIVWLEKARGSNPASPYSHSWLASAYGLQGDLRRATAELAEANRLLGGKGFSSILYMRAGYWGVPKIRALFEDTYFVGLRKAGMPEE